MHISRIMRHAIHQLHLGQVVLLWGLTVLGLWAFNSRRLEPALGVEEVEALATYGTAGPPARNADSLAAHVTRRESARSAMAEEIEADSLALIGLVAAMPPAYLDGSDATSRDDLGNDSTGSDTLSTAGVPPLGLPLASPDRHFAYATPVVDSTWPWSRTIPSRVRQRAVDGEAERVRSELDAYRELTRAWDSGRVKVWRSRVVKGVALALFFVAVGVTWVWFGRPRRDDVVPAADPSSSA